MCSWCKGHTDPQPRFPLNGDRRLMDGTNDLGHRYHDHRITHKYREDLMNLIIWLAVGGVLGWLASIVMRTDAQQGIFLNIVVGIAGAFLAGLVISGGSINNAGFDARSLIASFVGAVVLLGIVNLVRRGSVR